MPVDFTPDRIRDLYRPRGSEGSFVVSVEVFPPKTEKGDRHLRATLADLAKFSPSFVSCTYGAGGTEQGRTLDWCEEIQSEHRLPVTAHFTCVGRTESQLVDWLAEAHDRGVRNVMALRGDAPEDQDEFTAAEGGYRYATDLVRLIRDRFPEISIGVGGYPEKHPESPDPETDLRHLKTKCDAGADAVFTQLFFDNDHFYRWRDACEAADIEQPLVPGIMPVTDFARIERITKMCGSSFPDELAGKLESCQGDADAQLRIGVDWATEQCEDLRRQGVPGIHFYALHKSRACSEILTALGYEPALAE